jgi:signal transduction histidine kinase
MDARAETSLSIDQSAAQSVLLHAELRSILSNLSHELCRPLISLRAGIDLLLGDAGPPISDEQHRHLRTMVSVCDDLLRLTRSYLDYACLMQGSRPLHYGTYTLSALMREIDQEFAPTAATRRLAWECELEGDDATVTADASRCQQVFGNLAANALRYTPEGGRVRVLARHNGATWTVNVIDSGPGIPVEARTRVFEPFYRLPREERSGIEGTGLGLAICRELVDQMGGEITIGSELGNGTRVTVRLPSAAAPSSPLSRPNKPAR